MLPLTAMKGDHGAPPDGKRWVIDALDPAYWLAHLLNTERRWMIAALDAAYGDWRNNKAREGRAL